MTDDTTTSTALPWGLRPVDVWGALATGVLTLPDPARRSPAGRFALRSSAAAITGVGVWAGTGQLSEIRYDLPTRAGFTAGAVGLVYGVAELGEWLDRLTQRRLVRMGVRRPRIVMAVAGAGLGLALAVLDRRPDPAAPQEDEAGARPSYRPLRPHVRELVSAILEQTEDYDSLRLRAQLAVAQEEVWGEDEDARFLPLAVLDDVPLAVPHTFTFPVSARFTSARGVPCTAQLLVEGGRLSALVVDVEPETWEAVGEDWDPQGGDEDPLADVGVPRLAEVTFATESTARP